MCPLFYNGLQNPLCNMTKLTCANRNTICTGMKDQWPKSKEQDVSSHEPTLPHPPIYWYHRPLCDEWVFVNFPTCILAASAHLLRPQALPAPPESCPRSVCLQISFEWSAQPCGLVDLRWPPLLALAARSLSPSERRSILYRRLGPACWETSSKRRWPSKTIKKSWPKRKQKGSTSNSCWYRSAKRSQSFPDSLDNQKWWGRSGSFPELDDHM